MMVPLTRAHPIVLILQSLLDMMIKEEESLRKRLINNIQTCRAEMEKLYLELQIPVFEVTTTGQESQQNDATSAKF